MEGAIDVSGVVTALSVTGTAAVAAVYGGKFILAGAATTARWALAAIVR